jgi:RNA polymerase sigma-70 factor (ECF subfamily)
MSDEMSAPGNDDQRLRALMASYQAGRFEAFDELYGLVAPKVRRYLSSQIRDASRAEDVVQETFLQLHRARRSYDSVYPLMPWVMAIARHCWLMELRRARRRPVADEDVTAHEPPVRGEAEGIADVAELDDALGLLPAAQRQALLAHHQWGLSFQEIGARLGIAEAAARLRSSRGVRRLREVLSQRPMKRGRR